MPLAKLTNEQTYKFVRLYQKHYCLWKSDTAEYRNKRERKRALEMIVEAMNIPRFKIADCQIKIKNVRSHYLQEIKKILDTRKHPNGMTYTPQLNWFPLIDSFLHKYIMHQSPVLRNWMVNRSPLNADQCATIENCKVLKNENLDVGEDLSEHSEINSASFVQTTEAAEEISYSLLENPTLSADLQSSSGKRMRCNNYDGEVYFATNEDLPNAVDESEFDIFGRGVAAQLKSIPIIEAVHLQLKIQQLITAHRLKLFTSTM